MNKNCIVTYADGIHIDAQKRLVSSFYNVVSTEEYDILVWNKLPKECPDFNSSPWAFKPFCILEAKKMGYENVLWLDASNIIIRNPKKIFNIIEKRGYFLYSDNTSNLHQWSSDMCLDKLKIKRIDAKKIKDIRAHILGLNFNNIIGNVFLDQWIKSSKDGISFRGLPKKIDIEETFTNKNCLVSKDPSVMGHRHDQTVASIIAHKLKMKISSRYCLDYVRGFLRAIPLDIIILHDRTYKQNGSYINIDKYENNKKIKKVFYIFISFLNTIIRNIIYYLR